ncbi:MAG: glycosyl hydrolase, partial [Acidobacteria bacterium]|nr:glycosyl hydrolase [Acidobacteriota bacterium]
IAGNDGGVDISTNGGASWTAPPLPLGQPYHVWVDTRVPFRVAGALQDLTAAQGPSDSLTSGGIPNADWYPVGGGEAGWVVSDPSDPDIVYAGEYGGYLSRYDHRTGQAQVVGIYPENPSGHGGEDLKYRFQWTAPIAVSPHDPKVIYHAANVLFRSADGGQSWTAISPDLTRDDKSKETWAGGPITGDNTGVEIYCTIFVVAESPVEKGLIWAGSDDGLVHLTRDGGKTWTDVTHAIPGLPEWGTVTMIEPSHFDAGTAYLVVDAHRLDDMHPYLWKTANFGHTWKRLDGKLPKDLFLHAVREDPRRRGVLYLGTEHGVAFSTDDGATWRSLRLNMPAVAVHDLAVKDDDLVLAAHGRSFWILDHLQVLAAVSAAGKAAAGPRLLAVPDAVRWDLHQGPDGWTGENPPRGAAIYYRLDGAPKGEVAIDVLDAKGTVVTTLSSKAIEPIGTTESAEDETQILKRRLASKEPGVQRAVWDLSWAGAELIPGAKLDAGYPAHGPEAVPGSYTVRLTVDGKVSSLPLTVRPDPRVTVSAADLEAQLQLALEVRDAITRLTRTVVRLREVRQQLVSRNQLLKGDARAEPLVKASAELAQKLDVLEAKLHNPKAEIVYDVLAQKGGAQLYSRLSPLLDWVESGDGAPAEGVREVFADQQKELAARQGDLEKLLASDLSPLNEAAAKLGLPGIYVPAAR